MRRDSLTPILEEGSGRAAWIKNTVSVFLVCLAGAVGWVIAWKSGVWHPTPEHAGPVGDKDVQFGGQVLGYISAVAYLGFVALSSLPIYHLTDNCQSTRPPNNQKPARTFLRRPLPTLLPSFPSRKLHIWRRGTYQSLLLFPTSTFYLPVSPQQCR